jgi:hypothetical protein
MRRASAGVISVRFLPSEVPARFAIPLTSPPAQKARPAPVRMIAFTSSSTARSSQIVHSSRWSTGLTALSESGRLSVTVATRFAFSTWIVSYLL